MQYPHRVWKNEKFPLTKNISSIQLSSNLLSKSVTFTKFLPEWVRENSRNFFVKLTEKLEFEVFSSIWRKFHEFPCQFHEKTCNGFFPWDCANRKIIYFNYFRLRPLGYNNSLGMMQNHCITPKSRALTYFILGPNKY